MSDLLREINRSVLPIPDQGIDFGDAVAKHEKALIEEALRIAKGRQTRAAELLRLKPPTLCTKIKALGIDPKKFR